MFAPEHLTNNVLPLLCSKRKFPRLSHLTVLGLGQGLQLSICAPRLVSLQVDAAEAPEWSELVSLSLGYLNLAGLMRIPGNFIVNLLARGCLRSLVLHCNGWIPAFAPKVTPWPLQSLELQSASLGLILAVLDLVDTSNTPLIVIGIKNANPTGNEMEHLFASLVSSLRSIPRVQVRKIDWAVARVGDLRGFTRELRIQPESSPHCTIRAFLRHAIPSKDADASVTSLNCTTQHGWVDLAELSSYRPFSNSTLELTLDLSDSYYNLFAGPLPGSLPISIRCPNLRALRLARPNTQPLHIPPTIIMKTIACAEFRGPLEELHLDNVFLSEVRRLHDRELRKIVRAFVRQRQNTLMPIHPVMSNHGIHADVDRVLLCPTSSYSAFGLVRKDS